jgi:hypothetical protein
VGGVRLLLGGGLALMTGGALGVSAGFQKVFIDDGRPVIGVALSLGGR